MPLILEGAITDLSEPVEEHRSRQRVPGFALVEAGGDPPSQRWIFEPRSMKRVRSILPISRSASARLFWRG
jgi:hypothetical protein